MKTTLDLVYKVSTRHPGRFSYSATAYSVCYLGYCSLNSETGKWQLDCMGGHQFDGHFSTEQLHDIINRLGNGENEIRFTLTIEPQD